MKKNFYLLISLILFGNFLKAQNVTIENDDNTITINSPWGCLPLSPYSFGPTVSGQYNVGVQWTDFAGGTQSYQSTSPHDLVTVNNSGFSNQTLVINALNLSGYSTSTLSNDGASDVQYFPDYNQEFYSLNEVSYAAITIQTLDGSVKWIITFSGGTKITCVVLPVNLISFYGQKVPNVNAAKLYWQTENESNMSRYEIERSTTGANFQTIGASIPSVNSSATYNYAYTDNIPAAARQYYRLRMIDNDGKIKYSSIIYVNGLTAVAQPGSISCNYSMNGPSSLCTTNKGNYEISTYPDFSDVTWSAVPFYTITNGYKFSYSNSVPGGASLLIRNPNVITLTANVSRCSTGGTFIKYIFKGTPAVNAIATNSTQTNSCSGAITSYTSSLTVTPFPGTSAYEYSWYYDNQYISTGLSNTFSNSDVAPKNYEVRFSGPCGVSTFTGTVNGIGANPTCTPPQINTTSNTHVITEPCTGTVTGSTATVTINSLPCTSGGSYEWYINGTYNGTGLSRTFNTFNGPTYNYEIRFNGPCGLSSTSGTIYGNGYPPIEEAKIGPNPATTYITVDMQRPYCPPPPPSDPNANQPNNEKNLVTSIQIFDNYGNTVAYQEYKIASEVVQVNVQNIKRGNYRLKINFAGKYEIKQIKLVD